MIGILEHRLLIEYINYVYLKQPVATTYANYKICIIENDYLLCCCNTITSGHCILLSGTPQCTSGAQRTGTGITYGGQGQPMDIGRQKTNPRIWNNKPPYHLQNKSFGSSTKLPPQDLTNYKCYNCGNMDTYAKIALLPRINHLTPA